MERWRHRPAAAGAPSSPRGWWLAAAGAALAALALGAGCNLMTGADDIVIGGGAGGEAGGSATGANGTGGSGAGSGAGTSVGGEGAGTTATQGGSGATGNSGTGGNPPAECTPACGAHEHCELQTMTCVCDPGFVMQGDVCTAVPPGDPTTHTQQDVCDRWSDGHVVTTPDALVSSGADCDAGYLAQGALDDTLTRMNMFRWLIGLGPTGDDPDMNASSQLCANLEAWYTWQGGSPHSPSPSDSICYTAEGAATAGQSNLAWGSGHPAQAIDQFVVDNGNLDTMGHRRWIFNPPLDPVGIGYWTGGGTYNDGMCLMVFGSGGSGPFPAWTAFPPPGFVPLEITGWPWTFHGSDSAIASATASILRVDDNTPLDVTMHSLSQGYGPTTAAWTLDGWSAEAGKTYRVTVSGLSGGDVVYDVKPVSCN